MEQFKNPILSGFYPDPSICRVSEDYYLITSTFEYFPGVPIFHSKDLVNWRQIGHVLDRPSQLNLDGTPNSKGIYAPTLRYHNGIFYMITTFVVSKTGERKNFFVTAENPAGPWSDPYWLDDCPGIDSSLFFDDDGKVYVTANRRPPTGQEYPKHMEIWLQELDLETKQLVGDKYSLWDGALKKIHAQEAPHLYKVNGVYYLIIAEGGTGFTHSVTIAKSDHLFGPYEGAKTNPILTHRHLGQNYAITNVGHADIVETQNGEWWMVCLGTRANRLGHRNLGRESFLVPMIWEKGWPVVNPGKGIVELVGRRPDLPFTPWPSLPVCDHFETDQLAPIWNFIRTPRDSFWSVNKRKSYLRLYAKPEVITDEVNPSFIGRRQQHHRFAVRTKVEFTSAGEHEKAGIVLLQNKDYQYRVEYNGSNISLIQRKSGEDTVLNRIDYTEKELYIKVEATEEEYSFYIAQTSENWQVLYEHADGTILSSNIAGGFVGTYIGMYITSSGEQSDSFADFDYFEYQGFE